MSKYLPKTLSQLLFPVCCVLLITGCNKYLDVKPDDRFLSEQVFSNKASAQNALNGIYLNMAKPAMYGASLTSTTVDVLAQYYKVINGNPFYSLSVYNYQEAGAKSLASDLWTPSYSAVLNINLFLENMQASANVFPVAEKDILLGEAYGLRAFISFDMLRLFGPVYAANPTGAAIPYPTNSATRLNAILPAAAVIDSVISDLTKAQELLKSDPIRTEGVQAMSNDASNNFFRLRNHRMNYFAVRALMARVLLYKGDQPGALSAAAEVIAEAAKWFPWTVPSASAPANLNPDRIFSSELIFGVENMAMYDVQANNFSAALTSTILVPVAARLNQVYENYLNDYRFRSLWAVDRTTIRTDKTFFKYADVTDKTLTYRTLQPLIRMSELYYIAAECEPDEAKAQSYFNTVLYNRGIPDISFNGNRRSFITKEYEKEFWGEGQLFYYYKRINLATIPNGATGTTNLSMTAATYTMPLPLNETEYR